MRRFSSSLLAVIGVAAILVGINMLADARLPFAQLDVTQGRVFTLANGTRAVLAGLRQPITLRLFYSPELGEKVPAYGAYADRVRELLREYASRAHGMLRLEFYDPEPYSDVEDRATAAGLTGAPLDQSGTSVYFGLVGNNLLDDQRTIPFFEQERERFLEYDLTRLVYELSSPKRPIVGVMSSLPLDGNPRMMMMNPQSRGGAPWLSMVQLRQSFEVRRVPLDISKVDDDVQVLLVAQAQHLSTQAEYAIDQFVMRGGRLMVMVDPASEAEAAVPGEGGMPQTDTGSDLHRLLDAWGVAYDPNVVVGDLTGAWRVRANPEDRVSVVNYVAWFNIRDGINHDDPATADLTQVTVAAPGMLAKKPGADIEFTPLLSSSPQSGLIPAIKVRELPDPGRILAEFKPAGGPRVIAARVHGVLKSAFTGPPPARPAGAQGAAPPTPLPPHRGQTDGPANLVVVADSDILADRFWVKVQDFFGQQDVQPFSDNGPLVANLIGTLAGGDALIGLRGRGVGNRPFLVVETLERHAEAQFRASEQSLKAHLDDTEKKLADLRQGSGQTGAGQAVVTPEQRAAIAAANREIGQTRRQLRAVQLELKRDIDRLEDKLRIFDIVLVPAILAVVAIALGIVRNRRRARARA